MPTETQAATSSSKINPVSHGQCAAQLSGTGPGRMPATSDTAHGMNPRAETWKGVARDNGNVDMRGLLEPAMASFSGSCLQAKPPPSEFESHGRLHGQTSKIERYVKPGDTCEARKLKLPYQIAVVWMWMPTDSFAEVQSSFSRPMLARISHGSGQHELATACKRKPRRAGFSETDGCT